MRRRFIASLVGILSIGLLLAPAAASPAQAAPPAPPSISVTPAGTIYKNTTVDVAVDFPTSTYDGLLYGNSPILSLWSNASGSWQKVAGQSGKTSASDGKYTFTYNVGTVLHKIKVQNDPGTGTQAGSFYADPTKTLSTAEVTIDPKTMPPASGTLQVSTNGKGAVATFVGAAKVSGQTASLQIQTIITEMTREVTSQTWKTIATAKQNSSGVASFSISDPYEVKHSYRAVTGSPQVATNIVEKFAAPAGSKSTGVAQAYFNTNEQASVNTRTRYFEGQFTLVQAGSGAQYSECNVMKDKDGVAVTKPLLAAMKGRGNYSWSFSKKSFTLKLDKKTNLCNMGASKKWALVANAYDKSLLRNSVAGFIGSKLTNMAWTPDQRPVDFWMNGSYRGSYILIERIAPDTKVPRLPYDSLDDNTGVTGANTPGYLLEWDFRKGADKNVTAGSRGYVGIKDPENDYDEAGNNTGLGINTSQVNYINSQLDSCDAKLFGSAFKTSSGWRSCIDEKSAVDYYIGMELMKPVDGNMWASVYMWKPKGGKFMFGPMWDFDLAAGSANRAGNVVSPSGWYLRNVLAISAKQSTKTWFNRLNEDSAFRSAVRSRWNAVVGQLRGSDGFLSTQSGKIKASAGENFKKWSVTEHLSSVQVVKGSWSAEVSYLRSWLKSRINWMNSNV